MREWTSKILGGFKSGNVSGIKGKNNVPEQINNASSLIVKMSGVYAKFNEKVAIPKSNVQIPEKVIAKYSNIGIASEYKPCNAEQTNSFYSELRNQPINETDLASNKYLEEAFV